MENYYGAYEIQCGFYQGLGGFLNGKLEPNKTYEGEWIKAETPEIAMENALKVAQEYAREKFPHPQTRRVTVTLCSLTNGGKSLKQDELVCGKNVRFENGCAVVQSRVYRKKDVMKAA